MLAIRTQVPHFAVQVLFLSSYHFLPKLLPVLASSTAWLWARQVEPFGPITSQDGHSPSPHPPGLYGQPRPICPVTHRRGRVEDHPAVAGQAWEVRPADCYGYHWLTCLVTPGNGRLGKVLDFPVLLQKALQKAGGFRNGSSKASSQPLLPCVNRETTIRGSRDSHLQGPRTRAARSDHRARREPAEGSWTTG